MLFTQAETQRVYINNLIDSLGFDKISQFHKCLGYSLSLLLTIYEQASLRLGLVLRLSKRYKMDKTTMFRTTVKATDSMQMSKMCDAVKQTA